MNPSMHVRQISAAAAAISRAVALPTRTGHGKRPASSFETSRRECGSITSSRTRSLANTPSWCAHLSIAQTCWCCARAPDSVRARAHPVQRIGLAMVRVGRYDTSNMHFDEVTRYIAEREAEQKDLILKFVRTGTAGMDGDHSDFVVKLHCVPSTPGRVALHCVGEISKSLPLGPDLCCVFRSTLLHRRTVRTASSQRHLTWRTRGMKKVIRSTTQTRST